MDKALQVERTQPGRLMVSVYGGEFPVTDNGTEDGGEGGRLAREIRKVGKKLIRVSE